MGDVVLSVHMRRLLWTIAQHKYGWCYCPRGFSDFRFRSAEALERRSLVTVDRERMACQSTDAGRDMIERLFPVSPFILRTYDPQPGGWTPCAAATKPRKWPRTIVSEEEFARLTEAGSGLYALVEGDDPLAVEARRTWLDSLASR